MICLLLVDKFIAEVFTRFSGRFTEGMAYISDLLLRIDVLTHFNNESRQQNEYFQ